MGPCKDCRRWHCVCEILRLQEENRRQYQDIIFEHANGGHARDENDPAFRRFMAKVLS